MKIVCPACAAHMSLDAAVSDADARRFADLVAGLPGAVGKPLIAYLALFRPAKTGLRWSRLLGLAQELTPLIQAAEVTRNGLSYRVPADAWARALSMIADRPKTLTLPLKSHGYLLEILASDAERVAAKGEVTAEKHKANAGQRSGMSTVGRIINAPQPPTKRTPPPPGWRDAYTKPKET